VTLTVISLLSIVLGILGANLFGLLKPRITLGFIGNTIAGVFGSIFFIKSFGRLGFNPQAIMSTGEANYYLLILNLLISIFGGLLAVYLGCLLKAIMNK
jgi:hypothetical protein